MSVPDQISGDRLRGFTQFLVQHHGCAAGFDVSHPEGTGNGRVAIACRGCGGTFDYVTARIEDEGFAAAFGQSAATGLAPPAPAVPAMPEALPPEQPAPAPPAMPEAPPEAADRPPPPAAAPPASPAAEPASAVPAADATADGAAEAPPPFLKPEDDWRQRRRSAGLTIMLAVLAIVATTVAVIRIAGSGADDGSQVPREAPGATATPAAPPPPPTPDAGTGGDAATLRTQAYSVTVPPTWERQNRDGALSLSPAEGAVEVRIFFQRRPDLSVDEMVTEASSFLSDEHPGASVAVDGTRSTVGGSGPQIVADYQGGTERALVIASGPVRYLLLRRVDEGAPATLQRQALTVQRSFSPR